MFSKVISLLNNSTFFSTFNCLWQILTKKKFFSSRKFNFIRLECFTQKRNMKRFCSSSFSCFVKNFIAQRNKETFFSLTSFKSFFLLFFTIPSFFLLALNDILHIFHHHCYNENANVFSFGAKIHCCYVLLMKNHHKNGLTRWNYFFF